MPELFTGESEPVATNPILRGVDLALERLVRHGCFTDRTLSILDELRAEVLGAQTADEVRAHYASPDHSVGSRQVSPDSEIASGQGSV